MARNNKFNRSVQNTVDHEGRYLCVQTLDGCYFIPDSPECIQPGILAKMGATGPAVIIDTTEDWAKYDITTYGQLQR